VKLINLQNTQFDAKIWDLSYIQWSNYSIIYEGAGKYGER